MRNKLSVFVFWASFGNRVQHSRLSRLPRVSEREGSPLKRPIACGGRRGSEHTGVRVRVWARARACVLLAQRGDWERGVGSWQQSWRWVWQDHALWLKQQRQEEVRSSGWSQLKVGCVSWAPRNGRWCMDPLEGNFFFKITILCGIAPVLGT